MAESMKLSICWMVELLEKGELEKDESTVSQVGRDANPELTRVELLMESNTLAKEMSWGKGLGIEGVPSEDDVSLLERRKTVLKKLRESTACSLKETGRLVGGGFHDR